MKKKIFTTALAIALIVLSIAGSSLAYFTDVEEATNVFTAGNVDIKLTYGGKVADADDTALEPVRISSHVYPGQSYEVNATISNIGTEKAYVGAIVTIGGAELAEILADPAADGKISPLSLLSGYGSDTTAKCTVEGGVYKIYIVKAVELAASANELIFGSISIPAAWDHVQMNAFKTATVTVKAYATQVVGFSDAESALMAAFPDWAGYPSTNP